MMIIFSNDGVLDVRAITTFGLSVKESDSPIGRFGTGLKYAIAVVLRNGGSIHIWAGENLCEFITKTDTFRGEEKQFVFMSVDGQSPVPLGFTTDLGRDWEDWQAFREFYSNNIDEGGDMTHRDQGWPDSQPGRTVIAIDHRAFDAIFYALEEHFIGPAEEPLWENSTIAIYRGRSRNVFYQGIRVHELKEPAMFRYNIKGSIDLTEDRTAKYGWQVAARITQNLALCENKEVCEAVLKPNAIFERNLDYMEDVSGAPSSEFAGAVIGSEGDAPMSANQLIRAALPEDENKYTSAAPGVKGQAELNEAVKIAVSAGLEKKGVKFVLGIGLPVVGHYSVRGKNLILAESILEDQDSVTLAVIEGLADINSGNSRRYLAGLLAGHGAQIAESQAS